MGALGQGPSIPHLQSDQAADELSLVPNKHDVAEERQLPLDAVLNGNWSNVLSPSCDDQFCREQFSCTASYPDIPQLKLVY